LTTVGIRELKARTIEIIRRVRERGEVVNITYRGEVVARLVPVRTPLPAPADVSALMTDMDQLAAEISAAWPAGVSAVEAVRDARREL
jgi:prevent-host-death family protein